MGERVANAGSRSRYRSLTAKAVILEDSTIVATSLVRQGITAASRAVVRSISLSSRRGFRGRPRGHRCHGYGRLAADFTQDKVTRSRAMRAARISPYPKPARSSTSGSGFQGYCNRWPRKGARFVMNDKCSAGTAGSRGDGARPRDRARRPGRFVLESDSPASISSVCTVFAESELCRGRRRCEQGRHRRRHPPGDSLEDIRDGARVPVEQKIIMTEESLATGRGQGPRKEVRLRDTGARDASAHRGIGRGFDCGRARQRLAAGSKRFWPGETGSRSYPSSRLEAYRKAMREIDEQAMAVAYDPGFLNPSNTRRARLQDRTDMADETERRGALFWGRDRQVR